MFGPGILMWRKGRFAGAGAIALSAATIPDGSANNTVVGTASLSGSYTGTPVWAIFDADTTFKIDSSTGIIEVNNNTDLVAATHPMITVTISVTGTTPIPANLVSPILVTKVPTNSVAPAISGSAILPDTLTVSNGTWTGNPAPTYAYQWKSAGSSIGGAIGATYVLRTADVGSAITCTVTATNSIGSASVTSSATATVTETTLSYSPFVTATQSSAYTGATPSTSSGTAPYTYSAASLPSWASISSSTGIITGTPTSVETDVGITITVTDANGAYAVSSPFTITVSAASSYPLTPSLVLEAASDTGFSPTDNITGITTPTIDFVFGTVPLVGDVVTIKDGGTIIFGPHTITSGEAGLSAIAMGLSALSAGTHSLTARHSSGSSNSAWSTALVLVIETVAPTLSAPSGVELAQTTATIGVTTSGADGHLYYVVTTSATPPSKAQIKLGQNDGSTTAVADNHTSPLSISASGANSLTATGLSGANGAVTYDVYFMHEDAAGNQSNVSTVSWSQTDITAPTLSSATSVVAGATSGTLNVSSNESAGTLYWIVTTDTGGAPSAAQIKAGHDHSGGLTGAAGSPTVTGSGAQPTITATGLTTGLTYFAYFLHTDVAGNNSAVVGAATSFVTSGGAWTPASLTGLAAWYMGDVGVSRSVGVGSEITAWADQTSNHFDLSKYNAGVTTSPVYDDNPLNSLATTNWQAVTNQGLKNSSISLAGATAWAFGVMRNSAASPANSIAVTYEGNATTSDTVAASVQLIYFVTAAQSKIYHNGGFAVNNASYAPAQNTWQAMGSVLDATNVTAYTGNGSGTLEAGTSLARGTGNLTGPGTLMIGQGGTGGNALAGDIAEIIVGTGTLSSGDLTQIGTYLHSKWGV